MDKSLKRISLMVKEDQYSRLSAEGVNISGLIRDLIDDHLSDHKITLSVAEDTYHLYRKIVSNTGSTDTDLEVYFKEALKKVLNDRIRQMQKLQREIK